MLVRIEEVDRIKNAMVHRPEHLDTEGLAHLLPYRRLFWGTPRSIAAEAMAEQVVGRDTKLEVIPSPGHSQTHVAVFEPVSRTVFVGDKISKDVFGASRVGMHTVLLKPDGSAPRGRVRPDRVIRSLSELPSILNMMMT